MANATKRTLFQIVLLFYCSLLRIIVLKSAIELEMDDVVKSAKSLFQNWISKGTRIAPNIRSIVYTAGKRKGYVIYTKKIYIITNYITSI